MFFSRKNKKQASKPKLLITRQVTYRSTIPRVWVPLISILFLHNLYGITQWYYYNTHRFNSTTLMIRWRSDYIIGLVAPAIGPNKSEKLTWLIVPAHNIYAVKFEWKTAHMASQTSCCLWSHVTWKLIDSDPKGLTTSTWLRSCGPLFYTDSNLDILG